MCTVAVAVVLIDPSQMKDESYLSEIQNSRVFQSKVRSCKINLILILTVGVNLKLPLSVAGVVMRRRGCNV